MAFSTSFGLTVTSPFTITAREESTVPSESGSGPKVAAACGLCAPG
jgi:hypothetical protein